MDLVEFRKLHQLFLGDHSGAGKFRDQPIRISGAKHQPPQNYQQIEQHMQQWYQWSTDCATIPAVLRCAVLHAWLAHIHPFIDGNGRTARAVGNLELIRSGYPPLIIRKKDRNRYLEALADSDAGGDLRLFLELILERANHALTDLERSAIRKQDYDPRAEKIRERQAEQCKIWNASVTLLGRTIHHCLSEKLEAVRGYAKIREYEGLDLDDYLDLCNKQSVPNSWCFILTLQIPAYPTQEWLVYAGYRQPDLYHAMGDEGGPALFWSIKNPPDAYPKWAPAGDRSPYCTDMAIKAGAGDTWHARRLDGSTNRYKTTVLASNIARVLFKQLS